MSMIEAFKQKLLIALEQRGWHRHVKERKDFLGTPVLATKGAFFRTHEKDDAWLYLLSRHHHNILDIGCNIGQSSMLMLIGSNNRLVCVDPNPKALSQCAENLIFNRLSDRVSFINAFVGQENGKEIRFFTIGSGAAGSMFAGFAKTAAQHSQSFMVKTRTVHDICADLDFKPDLIKIDVEGAEQFVMGGIDDTILRLNPTIFVEIHSGKELNIVDNTNKILEWCDANNYIAYYLKNEDLLRENNISKRGRYHALLLPKGSAYPEYLKGVRENSTLDSVFKS